MAGSTLEPRAVPQLLSDGRAWGAGVAVFHSLGATSDVLPADSLLSAYQPGLARILAHEALIASYKADIRAQAERGIRVDLEIETYRVGRLGAMLDHYMATTVQLPNLTRLEGEIDVPIRSRTGRRASTRYRFGGFIDGFTVDLHGHEWIVEFKLRGQLTEVEQIMRSQQLLWYAWARQISAGVPVVGVLVDERWNEIPNLPRVVNAKRKGEGINGRTVSHAVDQITTSELYVQACAEFGVEPNPATVETFMDRRWQSRTPIMFRPSQLEEAGLDLVSAAKFIRDLDSGELRPIRNAQPALCRSCRFRHICSNPKDDLYVESLYERKVPKRERPLVADPPSVSRSVPPDNADAPHVGPDLHGGTEASSAFPRAPFLAARDSSRGSATNGAIPNVENAPPNPFLLATPEGS